MHQNSSVGRFLLVAAVVTGCARNVKPPAAEDYSLAGLSAPVRDYSAVKVCNVKRAILAEELFAFNALLEKWLDQTSADASGMWSDEQLALLEEGSRTLPPVLATQQATIDALSPCKPDRKYDVSEIIARGVQLIPMARNRVETGPKVVAEVRRRKVVDAWRTKELATQETERTNWCPPTVRGMPDVFYAWQDETGKLEWLFCDGSKVVAEPNAEPQHVGGPGYDAKKRGANKPDAFVKAAQKFPDSEIRRPPSAEAAAETPAPAPEAAPEAAPEGEASEAPASEG